jgi:hypothetical protein
MSLRLIRLLQSNKALASILVTAVTLVLVAGVLLVTTSLGCGPANQIGVKITHCITPSPVAARTTPSPTEWPAKPGNVPPPNPIYYPPAPNPASSYPPNTNPASNPPPYTNPASGYPPQAVVTSGTADPFYPPSSGGPPAHPLSCKLPMYAGPPGSGGFVNLPQGNFVADPRSAVSLPQAATGSPSPAPNISSNPYGQGPSYGGGGYGYGMAWEPIHQRWLPVKSEMVSPDGNRYAYPSTNSIYLVDAAANTQVELAPGHTWSVVRVLNDRVYATIPNTAGFWVVPFSGAARQVTPQGYWQGATAAAAYGMQISAVPSGATSKLVRLDISTGVVSDWFSRDGANSSVYGFDFQGNPIIYSYYYGGWTTWLTKSPSNAAAIANSFAPYQVNGTPFADSNGIWFPAYYNQPNSNQNGAGVALYVAGSGMYWMASIGGQLAGGCA